MAVFEAGFVSIIETELECVLSGVPLTKIEKVAESMVSASGMLAVLKR